MLNETTAKRQYVLSNNKCIIDCALFLLFALALIFYIFFCSATIRYQKK